MTGGCTPGLDVIVIAAEFGMIDIAIVASLLFLLLKALMPSPSA
jgi:hypothetical protein